MDHPGNMNKVTLSAKYLVRWGGFFDFANNMLLKKFRNIWFCLFGMMTLLLNKNEKYLFLFNRSIIIWCRGEADETN